MTSAPFTVGIIQDSASDDMEAVLASTEEKVRRADFAIWTDGTYDNTKRQVLETLEQLARR